VTEEVRLRMMLLAGRYAYRPSLPIWEIRLAHRRRHAWYVPRPKPAASPRPDRAFSYWVVAIGMWWGRYVWHPGYWTRPPYPDCALGGPRHDVKRYY